MGMIQLTKRGNEVFKVGCLGKIDDLRKSSDGRILINLNGITRFEILEEVENSKLYREFKVDYKKFTKDLNPTQEETNIDSIIEKSKKFFKKNGLLLNWREFEKIEKIQKINTLAMIAPITNEEKQKLLESVTFQDKVKTLENILNFYLTDVNFDNQTLQ